MFLREPWRERVIYNSGDSRKRGFAVAPEPVKNSNDIEQASDADDFDECSDLCDFGYVLVGRENPDGNTPDT